MRPDDINPRTGLVVALVSIFLVFGFMFTVSGIKGETLGDIPLLAIGPAICLPGIAAIALTRKTDGCSKWPNVSYCPPCGCCRKKHQDKEVLELLGTPSDLESGKSSCDELALKARDAQPDEATHQVACGGKDSLATPAARDCVGLDPKVAQEEMLRYLEKCYPEMPGGNIFVAEASPYSALDQPRGESPGFEGAAAAASPCPPEDDLNVVPSDSIIVCSYTESSPYDRYCCYINPTEDLTSDPQAIV